MAGCLPVQGGRHHAPASWWSGWEFEDVILESGYSYCTEAMNGLDWASEEFGKPSTIMAVHYPGDYGGDSAAGVAEWAKVNGVDFQAEAHDVQTTPNAQAGNQDAAVERILRADPDVVMVATGPAEMAEIVGKAAAQGYKGRFIGSVPTYNPALLKSEAAPAIKALYHFGPPGDRGAPTPRPTRPWSRPPAASPRPTTATPSAGSGPTPSRPSSSAPSRTATSPAPASAPPSPRSPSTTRAPSPTRPTTASPTRPPSARP